MNRTAPLFVLLAAAMTPAWDAAACLMCVSEMQTLSEELGDADLAVIARLTAPAPAVLHAEAGAERLGEPLADADAAEHPPLGGPEGSAPAAQAEPPDPVAGPGIPIVDPQSGKATFAIEHVLKGRDELRGGEQIRALFFGRPDAAKRFLVRGVGMPTEWRIPIELSPLAVDYVEQLPGLPEGGPERLAFFQPYLEHEDPQLAQDAYDEFARAPHDDLIRLGEQIDYDRVKELIDRPLIAASRRRLFFIMLSVAGSRADLPMLEAMIASDAAALGPAAEAAARAGVATGGAISQSLSVEAVLAEERRKKLGLDAMIACYLTLAGDEGLDLIDRRFLANPHAEQTHLYRVLMALRVLADEQQRAATDPEALTLNTVSRERLLASARLLLDSRDFADQVIIDLARWEDWSVAEKLAEMFKQAGKAAPGEDEPPVTKWVREPIVTYLDVAAEQSGAVAERAQRLLAELEPIDPTLFERARRMYSFGVLGRARPPAWEGSEAPADDSGEAPPNPAEFALDPTEPAPETTPAGAAEQADSAATAAPALASKAAEGEGAAGAASPGPAGAEPRQPPSRLALVAGPLVAVAACFGLFWLILRGGV